MIYLRDDLYDAVAASQGELELYQIRRCDLEQRFGVVLVWTFLALPNPGVVEVIGLNSPIGTLLPLTSVQPMTNTTIGGEAWLAATGDVWEPSPPGCFA